MNKKIFSTFLCLSIFFLPEASAMRQSAFLGTELASSIDVEKAKEFAKKYFAKKSKYIGQKGNEISTSKEGQNSKSKVDSRQKLNSNDKKKSKYSAKKVSETKKSVHSSKSQNSGQKVVNAFQKKFENLFSHLIYQWYNGTLKKSGNRNFTNSRSNPDKQLMRSVGQQPIEVIEVRKEGQNYRLIIDDFSYKQALKKFDFNEEDTIKFENMLSGNSNVRIVVYDSIRKRQVTKSNHSKTVSTGTCNSLCDLPPSNSEHWLTIDKNIMLKLCKDNSILNKKMEGIFNDTKESVC